MHFSVEGKPIQQNQPGSDLTLPILPYGRTIKALPRQLTLYQNDNKPLGRRTPLLFVHGLKAEYCPGLRWDQLVKHLTANSEFAQKYKIFFVRYNSAASLGKVAPELQSKIAELYSLNDKKTIAIVALSMGGNIVYEAMLNPETNKQVKLFLAMATPFHGSPLFSCDWIQFGMYKNILNPLSRMDRSLAYRLYFWHKTNLLNELGWDNCDRSLPDVGPFASLLPLGPHGNLSSTNTTNQELVAINEKGFAKSKIIAYSGFLPNSYRLQNAPGTVSNALLLPYKILTVTFPAHLGLEHPVLKMLNDQISTVPTTQTIAKRAGTKYIYNLNDGITPVISALFLPDRYCTTESIVQESDFTRIKPLLDVGIGRIFSNIDHLTFIDGYRPMLQPSAIRDELNPEEGSHKIFDWILYDLGCRNTDVAQSSTITTYN